MDWDRLSASGRLPNFEVVAIPDISSFSKLMRPKARSASQPKSSLIDERGSGANKLGCTKKLCSIEHRQTLNVGFSSNDQSQSSKEGLWPGVKFAKIIMIRVSALR